MTIIKVDGAEPERIDTSDQIQLAQWYWVKLSDKDENTLMCVTALGSNYIGFNGLDCSCRVHLDQFSACCTRELNYRAIIRQNIVKHQKEAERLLGEINALTQRLGVSPTVALEYESDTRSLSVLNAEVDVKQYKKSLIRAKEKTLPELFKQVEDASREMSSWMKAELIPLKASLGQMKDVIEVITDRVFHVELYAGLSEQVVQVRDGAAAAAGEKLHLMQRRCYMDEECLADYRVGGMDIHSLKQFDAWLAEPEHLQSLLPFPRCMTAFRIRRNDKKRDWSDIRQLMIAIAETEADKFTYLYIRNGAQLYRMCTTLEFGEKIFPNTTEFGTEPMVAYFSCDRVENLMTKREHEALVQKEKDRTRNHAAWCKANAKKPEKPDKKNEPAFRVIGSDDIGKESRYRQDEFFSPYRHDHFNTLDRYEPFDQSNVHYDDIAEHIATQIKQYNRIALIIQGLFDRSPVLHPHPPVKLWDAAGFEAAVKLIRDSDGALHAGEQPDFEAYRAEVNASLSKDSVTIGQDDFWQRAEAVRENARERRNWRSRGDRRELEHFSPYGNPGPGYIAKVATCGRTTCTFTWQRERSYRSRPRYYGDPDGPINCHIQVPHDKLFNVSAYKPGDFRRFYADPRTRAEYLQWAPFLIAAEEWHAGNHELKAKGAKK